MAPLRRPSCPLRAFQQCIQVMMKIFTKREKEKRERREKTKRGEQGERGRDETQKRKTYDTIPNRWTQWNIDAGP